MAGEVLKNKMTTSEICEKIMTDEKFIKSELDKIAIYYNLKHTIRWARDRGEDITESVAEHIYGMHVLCSYFLPLIDPKKRLNHDLIHMMITWHDMAEAVVSDMTTRSKTAEHKASEKKAETELVKTVATHLHDTLETIYQTFDDKATPEAILVKALDKIEPMFHLYFLQTRQYDMKVQYSAEWEATEYRQYRANFVDAFPIIKRFDDVLFKETEEFYTRS